MTMLENMNSCNFFYKIINKNHLINDCRQIVRDFKFTNSLWGI
jgi:hypothetical protein